MGGPGYSCTPGPRITAIRCLIYTLSRTSPTAPEKSHPISPDLSSNPSYLLTSPYTPRKLQPAETNTNLRLIPLFALLQKQHTHIHTEPALYQFLATLTLHMSLHFTYFIPLLLPRYPLSQGARSGCMHPYQVKRGTPNLQDFTPIGGFSRWGFKSTRCISTCGATCSYRKGDEERRRGPPAGPE